MADEENFTYVVDPLPIDSLTVYFSGLELRHGDTFTMKGTMTFDQDGLVEGVIKDVGVNRG